MDVLSELLGELRKLASEEETVVSVADWEIQTTLVRDTVLKDLVPAGEQDKKISLLQKQQNLKQQNGSLSHNGSACLESESEDSRDVLNSLGGLDLDEDIPDTSCLLVEDARTILIMYSMLHSPTMLANNQAGQWGPLLPLWVLCDASDPERTSLVGCEQTPAGPAQDSDSPSSSFIFTTVTSEGPILKKSDLPSLQQVLLENYDDAPSMHITNQAFAQFEVLSAKSADLTLAESTESSYVTVECSWNQVRKILESPANPSCKVHICAVYGDRRNAPLMVYKELSTAVSYAESLVTGEVSWVVMKKEKTISEVIQGFLAEIKEGPTYQTKAKEENEEEFDTQLCWKRSFERSDLDFTERLWNLLRDHASCYDDVITAFSLVVNALNRGQIQPMVHSSNKTTLAKEIRTLYQNPAHILDLESAPMLLLVEIAIDKLQRDYTNFFLAQNLTTLHSLGWFVPAVDLLTMSDLVTRLRSLHCVLEVAMLASESLRLPTNNIHTLIRNALEYYKDNGPDTQKAFVLPVEETTVLNLCKNQLPSVWRLSTCCLGRGNKTSSTYQLSVTPCLDTLSVYIPDVTQENIEDEDKFLYYVTRVKRDIEPFPQCFSS